MRRRRPAWSRSGFPPGQGCPVPLESDVRGGNVVDVGGKSDASVSRGHERVGGGTAAAYFVGHNRRHRAVRGLGIDQHGGG